MHRPENSDKDFVRLPKLTPKSKSLPGNSHPNITRPHESVSAKAWFYVTPNSQFGTSVPTKASNPPKNGK